jgi:hypothetical protein
MTASMYQDSGGYSRVVGQNANGRIPGPVAALKQGSVGPTMSDLQFMQQNERKQHEDTYRYEHGHNDGSAPGWKSSF